MWRTVIVNKGEKLIIRDNRLIVYSEESEHKVPVDDIYAVVIDNQYRCLNYAGLEKKKAESIRLLEDDIISGDKTNREAVAAKKYFQLLFGSTFRRNDEDITNAALDYGYSIMRSSVCKTLTVYGFNCVLGIHHINQNDPVFRLCAHG